MADAAVPIFKKRAAKANVRKIVPPPSSSESSSGSEAEDDDEPRVKRRKTAGKPVSTSTVEQKSRNEYDGPTQFEADRTATIDASDEATKQSHLFDDDSKDSLSAKNLLGTTRTQPKSFIQKNPNAPDRKVGPIKAPTNIRTITVTDYAPDVCKDYKQTGFCGFGDSCKFLHAREDYAAGWKLDREWEISGKSKKPGEIVASATRSKTGDQDDDADAALLEKIPFACIICKKDYTNPIVTRCGHYFCEACALKRYRKDPTCAACGASTNGVFNVAKNLRKLLDKKRERETRLKEKVQEEGGGVDDDKGT